MAKKKNELEALNDMISHFLDNLRENNPEMLEDMLNGLEKRRKGNGIEVLDELRDFKSDKHVVPTKSADDIDLPYYVDFWYFYDDDNPKVNYEEFMEECQDKSKSKLAKDINALLDSIPAYYEDDFTLTSHQAWIIAAPIIKYGLKQCHVHMLNVLRCRDYVIQDLFMDDEVSSINMFAEMCHDQLQELHAIAIDDNVMPYARGVAIAALAKSIEYSAKDSLLIFNYLKNIIEVYRTRAKEDRKVSVALIRATSLVAARMHLHSLLPFIEEVYSKLRISGKGIGAISRVRELMDDEEVHLGTSEHIIEYLEGFLAFNERMFGDSLKRIKEEYDDDDEYDDFEYDDDDDDLYDDDDDDDLYDDDYSEENGLDLLKYSINDLRKTKVINGKVRIIGEDFVNAHPKDLSTSTDRYYMEFANKICKQIANMAKDLEFDDIKSIAMKCTLYFEDMIADAGIWRSFVEKMREMYGKPLPFHKVDEDNYYPDEPNLADVKLLVWLACLDSHLSSIYNPENNTLMQIAEAIYDLMNDQFEEMPVNEALHDYFHDASFMDDFYNARDAVKWVYLSSYLTSTTKALNSMVEVANEGQKVYGVESYYQAESTMIYDTRIGPLALTAPEWLALILRSNGKVKEADQIEVAKGSICFCHVEERRGDVFTIKDSKDKVFVIDRKNFGDIVDDQLTHDYFFACLVPFGEEYYLSGICSWHNGLSDAFDKEHQKHELMKRCGVPDYDKLLKGNGGSPLFYFKSCDEARQFLKNSGIKDKDNLSILMRNYKDCVLFFSSADAPFSFHHQIARYIKDSHNPCYNEVEAKKCYLMPFFDMPYQMAVYLFKHNYLPWARFNNQQGEKAGIRQVQENYDFVFRCLSPEKIDLPNRI